MVNLGDGTWKWINSKLRSINLYEETVIPTFNTKLGGVMSIVILIITSYATAIYLNAVFDYAEIKFNKNEKKLSLANNKDIYNFTSDKGIKFAFYWNSLDGLPIDETVGTIKIKQYYFGECLDDSTSWNGDYEISLVPCDFSEFSQGIVNNQNLSLLCPSKESELLLQSNNYGIDYKYVTVDILVWYKENHWKPYQDNVNRLNNSILEMLIVKPYFDYSDMENPIKYHIDDTNYLFLNFDAAYILEMYVRKSEYTLHDSIFGSSGDKSDEFYSIEKSRMIPVGNNQFTLAQIRFHIDHQIDQYERTVQTVFEVVGIIGGNYEILRIWFGLFIGMYTSKMFDQTVANNYKVGT